MSREQNAGQNHNTKLGNEISESMARFTYLDTTKKKKKEKMH
jgi:hypothetical protein